MEGSSRRKEEAAENRSKRESVLEIEQTERKQAEEEDPDGEREESSIERIFDSSEVPRWQEQVTIRALAVSFLLSVLFCFIVMKLNLTTGIIPSLNFSAGLLGFFFVKTWTKLLEKWKLLRQPFTRQENAVIQTCVVASSGIAFSGGFGSYLFGMSERIANQANKANDEKNIKDPELGWMIGFLLLVSFLGLFSIAPLRKIMVIDYKLIYPSSTTSAHLINNFHTQQGSKLAKKQVKALGKFFSFSFLWGFFQWFFIASDNCGFKSFPIFGLKALENRFYVDFSATYVGVGMICPYIVNLSLLLGAVLSWGIMWPIIGAKKGDWYPAELPATSLHGLQGYRVFIAIALILGDGVYNFIKVRVRIVSAFVFRINAKDTAVMPTDRSPNTAPSVTCDDERRIELFLKDQVPLWFAAGGFIVLAAISIGTLPHVFPPLKWYYILVAYIFAPIFASCNAYGCGLTDLSLASAYGKLAIFAIGAWAGASNGGVLAGLAACGVMMNIVSTASNLMQGFKTGYLTLASPRSMFLSQVAGTLMGCVISPCVFWLLYKAFNDLGMPVSEYSSPNAVIYRNMAILGVSGLSSLPKHCPTLCYVFFAGAILVNVLRDSVGKRTKDFIPIPMVMAVPFYLGSYFAIDMCVGSLILFMWEWLDKEKADALGPAVASGLICGDGIWVLPQSVLSLAGVKPPICMKFLSRRTNVKVDDFLQKLS